MSTTTSLISFSSDISFSAKELNITDGNTSTNPDIVWSSANLRGLLKLVDPLGNTVYNNTDKTSPDITAGGGTATLSLPTDGDGNIISGNYTITETVFDVNQVTPTSFDASTVAANAIPVTNTFITGQRLTYSAAGGGVIGGLTDGNEYFFSTNSSGSSIKLSASYADALAGTDIAITAGTGTQTLTAVDFERSYVADYTFTEPTTVLDVSWSVINPIYFKSVDNTGYDQNGYSYTISRTQTLFNPSVIGGSLSQTGKTFNTSSFYTGTSTMRLLADVDYTVDGYYSEEPNTNVTYTISYVKTTDKDVYVDGSNSVCQMYCCIDELWEKYQSARTGMKSNASLLKASFEEATSNWFLMKQSFECNQSQNVAKYRAEIQRITNCTGDGCDCGDVTPTQVIGIGTTTDVTKKLTYTASGNITSYTETELKGLSWSDGDFLAFVDGQEVESTSGTSSFNSATGEFTFGFTVFTGTEFYFQIIKR